MDTYTPRDELLAEIENLRSQLKQAHAEQEQIEKEREQSVSLLLATLESTADGILAVDPEGNITRVNQRFAELWYIPPDLMASSDKGRLRAYVFDQVANPDEFLSKLYRLRDQPEAESHDVLTLKDGRVFERYSCPQRVGEEIVGRVWSYRDVTDRARAEAEKSRSERVLLSLSQATQAIQLTDTPVEVYRAVGDQIARLDLVAILLEWTDETRTQLAISYHTVQPPLAKLAERLVKVTAADFRLPVAPGSFYDQVVSDSHTRFIPDMLSHVEGTYPQVPRPAFRQLLSALNAERGIAAPLCTPDNCYGVLLVTGEKISESDITAINLFAHQIAISLEKARLFQAEREQRLLAEVLSDNASAISSTLDVDEVLDRILANIERVVPHDAANIMLIEGKQARVVRYQSHRKVGSEENILGYQLPLDDVPNLRLMLEGGEPHIVSDTQKYEWISYHSTEWIRSNVGAPIHAEGKTIGFLSLHSAAPNYFTAKHAERLAAFANQAAIAIHNAQMYQKVESYTETLEEEVCERTRDLQRTRDRIAAILDSIGEAIIVVTPTGAIEQVNPAFEQQTDYSRLEVALLHHKDILLDESVPAELLDECTSAMRDNRAWRGELPVRRKDGTNYEAAISITPLLEEGRVTALVGSLTDISAMKEVQRMKDMFVSNVSHELRTPIASLKLNRALLQRDPGRSEVYISRMSREITRLNGIVENLLRLARLDQGRAGISIAPCDLNHLANGLVVDREPLAEDKGLSVALEAEPDLPSAQADVGLLEQALSVFLANSLNYTPADGQITVLTQSRQENGTRWVGVGVRDTGPGIPPDEQRHLFERFFRGKTGRDSGMPGTGLGLAIAHEIVERHGGQIELISEGVPGKGSTFVIWLPVCAPGDDSGGE